MSISSKKKIPIFDGLFTWPSNKPCLIGGRCKNCDTYFFPKWVIVHRPGCRQPNIEEIHFSRQGKLVSYTVQRYLPPPPFKSPEPFVPYGVGLAAFPEGLKIPGMITGCRLEDLKLNMTVEVVVEKLYEEGGTDYLTWKYRPV